MGWLGNLFKKSNNIDSDKKQNLIQSKTTSQNQTIRLNSYIGENR